MEIISSPNQINVAKGVKKNQKKKKQQNSHDSKMQTDNLLHL